MAARLLQQAAVAVGAEAHRRMPAAAAAVAAGRLCRSERVCMSEGQRGISDWESRREEREREMVEGTYCRRMAAEGEAAVVGEVRQPSLPAAWAAVVALQSASTRGEGRTF